jgi:hypothetical protein
LIAGEKEKVAALAFAFKIFVQRLTDEITIRSDSNTVAADLSRR